MLRRRTIGCTLAVAGALLGSATAQADIAAPSAPVQMASTSATVSTTGFSFEPAAGSVTLPGTTVAPMGRNFVSPQLAAYYNANLFNYFLAPPPDTRAYTDYFLLTYPGYVISTWTDRVAGVPSTGVGTATDQWTAGVYYMPRVHAFGPPTEHPQLTLMPKFHPHPELDHSRTFEPTY